ncbi:hypothetical protein BC829DRAFT_419906 [Chytridium lagenaria]|nr:hypothetical protein BC829DRAFT_419906 [Chytridium lagenaria]
MSMSSDMASSARNNRLAWVQERRPGHQGRPSGLHPARPGEDSRGVVYMRSTYYQSGIKNSSKKPSDEATKVADSTPSRLTSLTWRFSHPLTLATLTSAPPVLPSLQQSKSAPCSRNPIDTTVDNAIDNNMVGLSTPRDNLTAHASSSAMIEGAITMNGVKLIDNVGGPSTVIEKDESILETTPTMESLGTTELAMTTSPIHTTSAQGSNANMDTFASGSTSPNTHRRHTPTPLTPYPPTPPVNLATTVSTNTSKSGIYGAVVVQKAEAIAESFVDEVWSHSSSSTISLVDDDDDDDDGDGDLKSFGRALVKHSDVDNTIRLLRVLPIALPTLAICSPIIVASIASSTIPTLTAWLASRIHGAFVWKKAEMTSESGCWNGLYNGGYNSSHYLRNFSIAPPTMAYVLLTSGRFRPRWTSLKRSPGLVEQTAINGAMLLLQIEEITESLARIWFDCPHSVLDDVLSINDGDGAPQHVHRYGQVHPWPNGLHPNYHPNYLPSLPHSSCCALRHDALRPDHRGFRGYPDGFHRDQPNRVVISSDRDQRLLGVRSRRELDRIPCPCLFKDGPVYPLATSNSSATLVDGGMSTATSSTDLLKDDKDGKDDSDVRSLLIYLIADPNEPEDEEPLHRTLLTPPHLMKGLPPPPNPTDEWVQPPYRGGGIHAPNSLPVHRIPAYMRNLPSVEPPKPTRKSYFGMFTDVAVNVAGWAVGKSGMEVVEGVLCGF